MILVAGITRSGLSLTMQMLDAGGFPVAGKFPAYECFPLGKIPWNEIGERAVKVVDIQRQFPPTGEKYSVILLRRDLKQQSRSINKFNVFFGLPRMTPNYFVDSLKSDYAQIKRWSENQRGVLELYFEDLIEDPLSCAADIQDFIKCPLNVHAMVKAVKPRSTLCYPGLLEAELVKEN